MLIGGLWTFWNYKKSRPYARKLELALEGAAFSLQRLLFLDISATLRNAGNSRQPVDQQGTYCELVCVFADLREELVSVFPVFQERDQIEPGESITDRLQWRVDKQTEEVVWFKLRLRVVSAG